MKKISITLVIILTAVFISCEQEQPENLEQSQQIIKEDLDQEVNGKWLTYCNSFKGRVNFGFAIGLFDTTPGAPTGTFILENCPNGPGSCYQVIQGTVRNGENFNFYALGVDFNDTDTFRVKLYPHDTNQITTNFAYLFLGPQFGTERNLGARNIVSGQAVFNNLSFDFPDQCNTNPGNILN